MKHDNNTLLILAGGMGSRYGGLKQIDPVGPDGESIIDYSMYDAIQAGFSKIVFVIRRYFEDVFREKIGSKLDGIVEVGYAFQELESFAGNFEIPADREKPWGTGHAVLVAKELIDEPFAVINADDFYGADAFVKMKAFLQTQTDEYAMVGYRLGNTLSEYGSVARGICECDESMYLKRICETTGLRQTDEGHVTSENGGSELISSEKNVSMNLWGFGADIFEPLHEQFLRFLQSHGRDKTSELYIPTVIDCLIREKGTKVKVLQTDSKWFGVTYREDKRLVQAAISKLIEKGVYPQRLWGSV